VILTGWRFDVSAWGTGPAGLFAPSDAQRGERLYVLCASCHGNADSSATVSGSRVYPARHNSTGHTFEHPDCELLEIVRNGGNDRTKQERAALAPSGALEMPAFRQRLPDDDIVAILQYIRTMWTDEQRQAQERLTRESCAGHSR
jgi:mono/diheme cytochrome c family protein